jgi:hypothetical protein
MLADAKRLGIDATANGSNKDPWHSPISKDNW